MCVCSPIIQHAKRMRLDILSCVTRPAILYFFTSSQKTARVSNEKFIERNMNVGFCLQFCHKTFPILRIIPRDVVINVYRSSQRLPFILVRFS